MAKEKKVKFKESIGLDIGSHSIKMVYLKKLHQGFKLLNYETRSTLPDGVEPNQSDLSRDRFAPVLSGMLRSMKINPKKVKHIVSSIGGDNTSIKQIKTIFLPDEELESALFFEAKKHLPIGGSEMILDYQVLSVEEKTNNMNILLASSTKESLNGHSTILTNAGLTPGIVDLESLAVANSFALNTFVEEGIYVILNLGMFKTNMVIYGPKAKFFSRDISWGGYHITKDIMKQKKLSYQEAEKYKLEHGLIAEDEEKQKDSIIALDITEKSATEMIVQEVKRSLRFYVKEAGNSDFRKILMVGGTAKLKGLPEYFTDQLKLETEVYNPFVNLEKPEKFKDKQDPQLALALGLAMRPE
ncbi:MAG: pilus assembly protein PilM [Candidatus Cloacimonetes bacterium]|nr:pilus assembly protein PilM [Candidatus Cloacimonadota bacterium]MCF7814154.1 pilus assembly protein PilM [Candidatus Cloacimonadota bacterium]MCF7868747.1 pilus assembly protein PilM [Candidatus Cloacimonadota bacterium]MCF7884153.1 pilus assembly protein PilM [Candidatus Cloacimonadota bacterium]